MIPVDQVLTGTNKRLILQMKELYALAEYEIEKTLLWALDEQNKLNKNEFKEACHDLFLAKQQTRSEEHTSELQSRFDLVCRLLLETKKKTNQSQANVKIKSLV